MKCETAKKQVNALKWMPENQSDKDLLLAFCAEIELLAENKMRITGKLEGAHYAAMCVLRKRVEKFE